jgi:hypothetical protein
MRTPKMKVALRRYPVQSLGALGVAVGCIILPGAAAAAAPVANAGQSRVTPELAPARSICSKVSSSSVSRIVGFTVPASSGGTSTFVIDKALKLSATSTICTFVVLPTGESPFGARLVTIGSVAFSKKVTEATLKSVAAAQQEKLAIVEKASHFKVKYSNYSGLGVTAIYFRLTASMGALPGGITLPKGMAPSFAFEGIDTLQGTSSFQAGVNNTTLSESSVAALVRLAMRL